MGRVGTRKRHLRDRDAMRPSTYPRNNPGRQRDGLAETGSASCTAGSPSPRARCARPSSRRGGAPSRSNVAADRIEMPYVRDPEPRHAADPQRRVRCCGSCTSSSPGSRSSIVLTDPAGAGPVPADRGRRPGPSPRLRAARSRLQLCRGVRGHQRDRDGPRRRPVGARVRSRALCLENLEDLACAGVPIQHPISGKTVGAVDLTCWRNAHAGPR